MRVGGAQGRAPRRPRRFLLVGGGRHGWQAASCLARAVDRGALAPVEVWVVDRDPGCRAAALVPRPDRRLVISPWDEFFERYLERWPEGAGDREADLVVPAPLTPHLFAGWLARALAPSLRIQTREPTVLPDTPFTRTLPDGGLALSFAEWRCPAHCVEPFLCPATWQPRNWDVTRSLVRWARALRASDTEPVEGPLAARGTHLVEGVAVHPLGDWARAARRLARRFAREPGSALVATVSGCHGVATLLSMAPRPGGPSGPTPDARGGDAARGPA